VQNLNCRVGCVNTLSSRATRPADLDAKILGLDLDIHFLGLGKHGDGRRGSMDAALSLGGGNALDAVDAALVAQPAENVIAEDLEDHLLVSSRIARACLDHFGAESVCFRIPGIHPVEVSREDRRLAAACPGPDLNNGVTVVVGLRWKQGEKDCLLEFRKLRGNLLNFGLGQFGELGVAAFCQVFVFDELFTGTLEFVPGCQELLDPGMLLENLPGLLGIVEERWVRDCLLEFLEARTTLGDQRCEIKIHGGVARLMESGDPPGAGGLRNQSFSRHLSGEKI
jgi:hypothetical protein